MPRWQSTPPRGTTVPFTYSIPSGITVSQGHLVHVPFGPRVLSGIVFRISDESPVSETREIARVPYPQPVLSPRGLALASWTSSYYMASLFDCAALMAPPGVSLRAGSYLSLNHSVAEAGLTPSQHRVVSYLKGREKVRREVLLKALGPDMEAALGQLARRGVVNVWSEWRKPTARPRHAAHLGACIVLHRRRGGRRRPGGAPALTGRPTFFVTLGSRARQSYSPQRAGSSGRPP